MKRNHIKTVIVTKKRNRFILIFTGLTIFALSCISPFEPDFKGEDNLLVVDGSLIKGLETQMIRISRSSSISQPEYRPVENCQVKIMDDSGTEFAFSEESQGKYVANIDDAHLNYDTQYKLIFSTPSGEEYESGYQKLLRNAPVDNIYCIKEYHSNTDSLKDIQGLQFYVDLDAPNDASRYFKWQIEETWEIHATWKINGVYDGKTIELFSWPSDSLYYCWGTKTATGIYTTSTINLSNNTLKKIPLHFKSHYSQDLTIKYCATVKQFALNEDAYNYWHQKETEMNESGQIYTIQPSQAKSNISNTGNPDEKVLGFFWVSSYTEKHLFLENPFIKDALSPKSCSVVGSSTNLLGQDLINYLYTLIARTKNFPKPPPVFIYFTTPNGVYFTKDECIDCRLMGGSTSKPDFWE